MVDYGHYGQVGGVMRSVNVAELKNRLSAYLNEVRNGEEILIRDRNLPIARLVPINQAEDLDAELLSLAERRACRSQRYPRHFGACLPLKSR